MLNGSGQRLWLRLALSAAVGCVPSEEANIRVLVFTATAGFRHDAIPSAQEALARLAIDHRWELRLTEDPRELGRQLGEVDGVVFLLTTGDVLGSEEEAALEAFIRGGGGYAGVHSASDTELGWPFYETLVGAYFDNHPALQQGLVRTERSDHRATARLPAEWLWVDEAVQQGQTTG
jgi:hypothetical protein